MTEPRSMLIRKRRVVAFRGRGPIYNWLRAHHDLVAAKLASGEASWPSLCGEMVRHGIPGARGNPPTPRAAAKVWQRVCRDVSEAAKPAQPPRLLPSRLPKNWQPEVVQQSTPARPAPASASPPAAPAPPPLPVPPLTPLVTTRSYGPKHIPDEELDLSLAPETYENERGEIVPMPLEARQRFARMKMQLQAETEERFRFGGW